MTIKDFFRHGKLLKQVKNAFIALIDKENPSNPSNFRPISLTNELYKIIARIIENRLQPFVDKLINL